MPTAFDVLAEPSRRDILDLLRDGERSVGELVDRLSLSQPGVSKHLRVLREAGLVEVRPEGQRRLYELRAEPLAEVDSWLSPYRRFWSSRLDALERHLDDEEDWRMQSHQNEYGTVEQIRGRWVLRFERRFPHPREKVWDAITRPEQISEWFGEGEIDLELVEGGKFELRTTGPPELVEAVIREAGEEALVQHNTVLRVDPPSVFEHTFGDPDSVVRWELTPEGDSTLLRLAHTEPPTFTTTKDGPRDLAGWHALLEQLAQALADEPVDWRVQRWEALRDEYAARTQ
jgi:DNA-binding transcriptional ArsR family regulator/uncharacterized protein YndB with AHSA1/START domain